MDPTRSVVLEINHQEARGQFELTIGEWRQSLVDIAFRDRLYRNSGVIQFDGQTSRSFIRTLRPYEGALANAEEFSGYFNSILMTFAHAFTFGWSPPTEQMITYDAVYHQSNNYIQGDPNEIAIKKVQASIISEMANPKKCVIAGCSNGELVRQCRSSGMDTYGFDVIPAIQEIAFPEVREFVRHGSLTNIPFTKADNFDTLVAIDVLEHIPERDLHQMVDQWIQLGVQKLILLINLNQFWFPGHITMRPLWWWAEQWKPHFHHVGTVRSFPHLPALYSNTGQYNHQWTLWER